MNRIAIPLSSIAIAIACAFVSGCASMAGVGGTSEYSCKAPEGVKCDSVSGTYYNSVENNLPSQRQSGRVTRQDEALAAKRSAASATFTTSTLAPLTGATSSGVALPPQPTRPLRCARRPACCACG